MIRDVLQFLVWGLWLAWGWGLLFGRWAKK